MFNLPKNAGLNWICYNGSYVPQTITAGCGYCTKQPLHFSIERKNWYLRSDSAYISMRCPACNKDVDFWIRFRQTPENADNAPNVTDIFMEPDPPIALNYDESIDTISPSFSIIYRDAVMSEKNGLNTLIGLGYRKALEFLLKDWMINEHPDEAERIKRQNISSCIKQYISDAQLKTCLERTIWLGNDEAHYVREWPQKSIDDLKKLLEISLHIIAGKLLIEKLPEDMPARNKNG